MKKAKKDDLEPSVTIDASEAVKQYNELKANNSELTADLQRTRADFENFRKQVEIQKQAAKDSTKLATLYQILPLLDDIDRAVATYEELAPLQKSLAKTLHELGLEKIDTKNGTEFNPDLCEAVMAEGEGDREVISETLRPGYYYEKSVLRPAMVKVQRTS